MKKVKVLIAGLAVTIFNLAFGMVTCGGVFSWVYKLEPVNIWKPMGPHGPGFGFLIASLVLNIILAHVYSSINSSFCGKNKYTKGLGFGLMVFLVGILPGMLATYTFMTVATTVVVYWTLIALVKSPIDGLIISSIYGEEVK